MSDFPKLPNGLTAEEHRVIMTILAYPYWTYVQVWRAVAPASKANNQTATNNVQEIIERPRVQAVLKEQQQRQLELVDRDIDEVDKRQFDIATVPITDILSPQGDILPPSEWSERARGAVESYSVRQVGTMGKDGPPIIEKRIKMLNPTTSAELVYKRRGLLIERTENKNLNLTKLVIEVQDGRGAD